MIITAYTTVSSVYSRTSFFQTFAYDNLDDDFLQSKCPS